MERKQSEYQINNLMKKLVLVLIILSFVFLRFWDIENRMQFTWDQVSNAWVMKDMLVDGKLPLEGMVAKLNSPIHIGPLYYYLLVPFYWVFGLDPVAAGVFAAVVSLGTAGVLFAVARRLFGSDVAVVSLAIYTFSSRIIVQDRIAWPVIFLPALSLVVFFSLVRIMEGKAKYLLLLGAALGFSLHIHFTAVFLFLYLFLCTPFIIRQKEVFKHGVLGFVFFSVWLIPIIAAWAQKGPIQGNVVLYFQDYYHGFHFVRVAQLLSDSLIEFIAILGIKELRMVAFLILPVFLSVYFKEHGRAAALRVCFLVVMWFAVPLVILSLYRGEISDYYFVVTRPIAVLMYAYLTVSLWRLKRVWIQGFLILFWGYALAYNMSVFFRNNFGNHLPQLREDVLREIEKGRAINFTEGDPKSYLYYIYAQHKN